MMTSSGRTRAFAPRFVFNSLSILLLLSGNEAVQFRGGASAGILPWRTLPPPTQAFSSVDELYAEAVRRQHMEESLLVKGGRVFKIRGGAYDDSEDEYSDEEDEEDLSFGDLNDQEFSLEDDGTDFAAETNIKRFLDAWVRTPPFTKTYLTSSLVASAAGWFTNPKTHEFPEILTLDYKQLKRGQIWRPITAFLNLGQFGLAWMMTAHFVWTYMSTLERLNHDRPYDFWIMMLVGCTSMLIGYPLMGMSSKFLGHNLSTFLVYIWSRYHEGLEVSIFELFTMRAELLPWFFLAQTFLLEGEVPIMDFLGIAFGHIYHHCKSVGILRAPHLLVNWYENAGPGSYAYTVKQAYRKLSVDFEVQGEDEDKN